MGKKKREKKERLRYTLTQFIDIICRQCGYCSKLGVIKPTASFCYDCYYKFTPQSFINKTLRYLKRVDKNPKEFEELFCDSCMLYTNIMNNPKDRTLICRDFDDCLAEFKQQLGEKAIKGTDLTVNSFMKAKEAFCPAKRSKKKERYIATPHATFFYNNNQEWIDFIKESLADDEHNNNEQNNNTAATRTT